MICFSQRNFTLAALSSCFAFAAHAGEGTYFSNDQAQEISSCLRKEISETPAQSLKALRFGEEWLCKQVIYLWDAQNQMKALVVNQDSERPVFKFAATADTATDQVFENQAAFSDEKKVYGYFSHDFLTGFFSYLTVGPAPHRQDYLAVNKDGYLLWEESVEDAAYNLKHFPALPDHPVAIYKNYPGTPEQYRRRVTTYGVCYASSPTLRAQAPCF